MKYKLSKDFADTWIKALREGGFTQAVKLLYTPQIKPSEIGGEAYCAMGIAWLCLGIPKEEMCNKMYLNLGNVRERYNIIVPDELIYISRDITELNDDKEYSLAQIANWIEENCEFI
jgi:hypothetical protein